MTFNWTCPYCNRAQTVTDGRYSQVEQHFYIGTTALGHIGLKGEAICCSNEECLKPTVRAWVQPAGAYQNGQRYFNQKEPLSDHRMMPESYAKPQPDFIPVALREDYFEACLIRDFSPKASATLSRRCLQGMIRDFCGIKKGTLFEEVSALKSQVESGNAPTGVTIESAEAIDQVRGVGNIGAHMEKEIDHIVPVDPNEAQLLIELIESLFEEWYVAREKRESRFSGIKELAASKKKLIEDLRTGPKVP